jgi:putative addiction module component (TIGR02574 family)
MASLPVTRERLEVEARSLPREERARLAEALLASLEEEAEIEQAWRDEIRKRAAQLDAGTVEAIPAERVFAEIDEILGA